MSELLRFLDANPSSDAQLAATCWERFGVRVQIEGDLYQFRYHHTEAKFTQAVAHLCRGHILRRRETGWRHVARPFDKFFGIESGRCPIHHPDAFRAELSKGLSLLEKVDGTCMQLWHDDAAGRWRASTIGAISHAPLPGGGSHFEELFWAQLREGPALQSGRRLEALREYTLLFELCTTRNAVITQYATDRLYFLAARATRTGDYLERGDPRIQAWIDEEPQVFRPEHHDLRDLGVDSLATLFDYVEKRSTDSRLGSWPEGFVVCRDDLPLAKVKNRRYLQRVGARGPDSTHARRMVVDALFAASLDDLHATLTPELRDYADAVRARLRATVREIGELMSRLEAADIPAEDRKAYARWVQTHVERRFHGFFYRHRRLIETDPIGARERFVVWVGEQHVKVIDFEDV